MPVHLLTGIPGHGKTNRMLVLLRQANKENQRLVKAGKPPRPIFACGIDGLVDGLAEPLDDPTKWRELPEGSLIFVDEAWKWFGHLGNASRQQTPPHVLDLAEHRHFGMDFVWTAQGPGQIYPFARPLIEQHWHCVRKFGTHAIDIYKWGEMVDEVKSQGMRDRAEKETTMLDSSVFDLYKSASQHTIKARIPWKVWLIPACAIAALILSYFIYQTLRPSAMTERLTGEQAAGLPAAAPTLASLGPSGEQVPLTPEEWLDRLTPRFPGLHESAPVFDSREVLAVPRRFCIVSGEGSDQRCNCYTEQGTPLRDVQPGVCVHAARWGEYDHFRAPPEPGHPNPVFQLEPEPVAQPTGTRSKPAQVGTGSEGQVQGLAPATLRASGGL